MGVPLVDNCYNLYLKQNCRTSDFVLARKPYSKRRTITDYCLSHHGTLLNVEQFADDLLRVEDLFVSQGSGVIAGWSPSFKPSHREDSCFVDYTERQIFWFECVRLEWLPIVPQPEGHTRVVLFKVTLNMNL